ncbi:hypothetical protein CC78DRAFT_535330, partial [Lojkania enalia]
MREISKLIVKTVHSLVQSPCSLKDLYDSDRVREHLDGLYHRFIGSAVNKKKSAGAAMRFRLRNLQSEVLGWEQLVICELSSSFSCIYFGNN